LGHFRLIFGFIFGSFSGVWQKNDQNDPKNEMKNARGFRDQNAGPDPGWLVAARGSKKKMDIINFLAL
jgi:hypothetical protein